MSSAKNSHVARVAAKLTRKNGLLHDPGRRLPRVISEEGWDALPHLNDEDRKVGKAIFKAHPWANVKEDMEGMTQAPDQAQLQLRNPWAIVFQNDPESFKIELPYGYELGRLVYGMTEAEVLEATTETAPKVAPEVLRRYHLAHLIEFKLAHELKCEHPARLFSTIPALANAFSREQMAVLHTPESGVWDEEERLTLQWTKAVMDRQVTDELFARAQKMWGTKQMLRYAEHVCRYMYLLTLDDIVVSDAEKRGEV